MPVFLKQLRLGNFLSFGPDSPLMEFGALNLVIGPNGSGKSNLGTALEFLRRMPTGFVNTYQRLGDPAELIWKGQPDGNAGMLAMFVNDHGRNILYQITFRRQNGTLQLTGEVVERLAISHTSEAANDPDRFAFRNDGVTAQLRSPNSALQRELAGSVTPGDTVLVQIKAPGAFPEIGFLQGNIGLIRLFRKWTLGPSSVLHELARADDRADFLSEDFDNLPNVLSWLSRNVPLKRQILKYLGDVGQGLEDYAISALGGRVGLYVQEGDWTVSATRMSDGTLKFLALIAILLHPTPPPLLFLEEPELGLHPDMIPTLADLLRDAATRTQLIVTTHSRDLIDCFTATPEMVRVCEKRNGQTVIGPAHAPGVSAILQQTTLGTMWAEGHIGGNRW